MSQINQQTSNYFIKDGYEARSEAMTFVEDSADYWNSTRIKTSGHYQYYVYKRAAEILRAMPTHSVVDIGCGYPRKAQMFLAPISTEITLIDQPSMEALISRDFPEMRFVPYDLEQASTGLDASFDCAICADVIEHLLDPDPLLAMIRKLLKPSGIAIISTPERDMERGVTCATSPKPEHVREWNKNEFANYIKNSGFEIIEHHLMPKGRLPKIEEWILPFIRNTKEKRYLSCQTVVCRVAA